MNHLAIHIKTPGRGLTDITQQMNHVVMGSSVKNGVCHIFVHHTSASLIIQENADPDVRKDLDAFFARLVPDGDALFVHTDEGPDDMPAHVRATLTATTLTVPVQNGRLDLGTWQGIYLWEHRHRPHNRKVSITVMGSPA